MSQVFLNVLTNAVEAIEDGGQIAVATRNRVLEKGAIPELEPGSYVWLSVRDTGQGMSPEVQARAFEPFFTTKFQGRGLGLAAVYGIVRNHGGYVTIESQAGHGTTCNIYVPALRTADATPAGDRASVSDGARTTVLVIEDDETVQRLVRHMLGRLGYRVLIAHSGQRALETARHFDGPIHLVLFDIEIPDMSGVEMYPLLVEARPGARIILYSGYGPDDAVKALLDAGASAFIQKPFDLYALQAEIQKALGA
jgi:CheY-like chemotaxis protein